jgi:hypothetical protein
MTSDEVQDFIREIEEGDTPSELADQARRFIYGVTASQFDDSTERRIAIALLSKSWVALTNQPEA